MLAVLLALTSPAAADEVIFLNGDRLTGKIVSAAGGNLVLKTDPAGEITIDLDKVRTFSSDDPVRLRVGEKAQVDSKIAPGPAAGEVQAQMTPDTPPQPLPITDITAINVPSLEWTGSLALNGLFTSGNSETTQIGFTSRLGKRWERDRLTLGADYTYGRQEDQDSGEESTTTDYGLAFAKYDHFFTRKFYVYGLVKLEHDGVADLELRFAPSVGVGYQWFEGPTFNLLTEAGIGWVYERYENDRENDFIAGRLAYAVDWSPIPGRLKLYHTLEYLPSLEDFTEDYLLNIVAGIRATVYKGFFADFRVEWSHDNTPAPGRKKDDTRIIVGVGWEF
jgi:putative salt-induced outer membrane protein YdiY